MTYNPVADIIRDYQAEYPRLKAAAEQAWQVRDVVVDQRADTDDPQERRLLAVAVDALGDAAREIERMATEAYRKAWTK